MAQSTRFVVHGARGRIPMNHNWPAVIISRESVVHITAAEVIPAGAVIPPPGTLITQNFIYHIGEANVWVSNISPHNNDHFTGEPGGVEFVLHVDFRSPISVGITITVEDQPPVAIQPF
jgi:hypothetical protein